MDRDAPASSVHGFLSSLRNTADQLLGALEERFSLLTLEFQEEKYRLIQIFIWISAASFAAMLAITFASVTLVYVFWETARLTVLLSLTGFYLVATIIIVIAFWRYLARQPKPFSATVQEIKEDRACIRPQN